VNEATKTRSLLIWGALLNVTPHRIIHGLCRFCRKKDLRGPLIAVDLSSTILTAVQTADLAIASGFTGLLILFTSPAISLASCSATSAQDTYYTFSSRLLSASRPGPVVGPQPPQRPGWFVSAFCIILSITWRLCHHTNVTSRMVRHTMFAPFRPLEAPLGLQRHLRPSESSLPARNTSWTP